MTYDPELEQLCRDVYALAEGAPEDEYDFVSSLAKTIERYCTDDERPEDFVVSQLVFSLLSLVMRHGDDRERRLAEECYARFTDALLGYTVEEADE